MQNTDHHLQVTHCLLYLYQLIILAPSTVAIVTRQGSDQQQRQEYFICFSKKSGFTLRPIQPHIPWILGVLSPGLQQHGCKTDHSQPPPPHRLPMFRMSRVIPPLPLCGSQRFMTASMVKMHHLTSLVSHSLVHSCTQPAVHSLTNRRI
jgi:hypothetical protein